MSGNLSAWGNPLEKEEHLYRKDHKRVLFLETLFPELAFKRGPSGEPLGWGMVPEQATGTYKGDPFYYRYRHDSATLEVWDSEEVLLSEVPSSAFDCKLQASLEDWTGDEYAGATSGPELFLTLLLSLREPSEEDRRSVWSSAFAAREGLFPARALEEALSEVPEVKLMERDSRWLGAPEVYLTYPGGGAHVRWGARYSSSPEEEKKFQAVLKVGSSTRALMAPHQEEVCGTAVIPLEDLTPQGLLRALGTFSPELWRSSMAPSRQETSQEPLEALQKFQELFRSAS